MSWVFLRCLCKRHVGRADRHLGRKEETHTWGKEGRARERKRGEKRGGDGGGDLSLEISLSLSLSLSHLARLLSTHL